VEIPSGFTVESWCSSLSRW